MENKCRVINEDDPNSGFTLFIKELEDLLLKYNARIYSPIGAINININGHVFRPYRTDKNVFLDVIPRRSNDILMRYIGAAEELREAIVSEFKDQETPSPLGDENV